jgi:hypothetical protein
MIMWIEEYDARVEGCVEMPETHRLRGRGASGACSDRILGRGGTRGRHEEDAERCCIP